MVRRLCPIEMYRPPRRRKRNVWSAASPQAKCMVRRLAASEMYGPPPRRKRNVRSAASPQAKSIVRRLAASEMYGPPPRRKRNVWSAASPQAKCMVRRLAASEMYGPPPRRKRNLKTPQVGLRKCIRPLLEWITPGQDGMRCALFSINWSVAKDYFRFRIWRAPGSTVVPSPHSPADLAGNRDLAVVARLQPHRPILDADMVHSWRVRPRRFERVC